MATLKFDAVDALQLLQHSERSPKHSPTYGDPDSAKAGLWLVHDHGVYLMSNGEPGWMVKKTSPNGLHQIDSHKVTYAETCNPDRDEDYYENARYLVGGDDFGQYVPASMIRTALGGKDGWMPASGKISITLTPRQLKVSAPKRLKPVPSSVTGLTPA